MKAGKREVAKKNELDSAKLIAAVRIRGATTMGKEMRDTLAMLRLNRKNHCVLLRGTDGARGMLQKAKDYITFGEISEEVLKKLVLKRGRVEGNRKLTAEKAETAVKEILNGGLKSIKPVFRLTPASGGFREIKQHYPRGELGYRGDRINELLERMI